MPNNITICYDLNTPGQDYTELYDAIESLGAWAHIQDSVWYVSCENTAEQVAEYLWQFMDANDSLYVVDAKNNAACWYGASEEVSNQIQSTWTQ